MKKPTHINILGVDIPLATIAYATSTVPSLMIGDYADYMNMSELATLGEWNNYYNESSLDIAKAIKAWEEEDYRAGINRQFYSYNTLSEAAYDGSI